VWLFNVRDLQFDPFTADVRPILPPIDLENFARLEPQWYKGPAVRLDRHASVPLRLYIFFHLSFEDQLAFPAQG
jgi:hypothetical protein